MIKNIIILFSWLPKNKKVFKKTAISAKYLVNSKFCLSVKLREFVNFVATYII